MLRTFLIDVAALAPAVVGVSVLLLMPNAVADVSTECAAEVLDLIRLVNMLMALAAGLVGGIIFARALASSGTRHACYVALAILALAAVIGMMTGTGFGHAPFDSFMAFIVPVAVYCVALVLPVVILMPSRH